MLSPNLENDALEERQREDHVWSAVLAAPDGFV